MGAGWVHESCLLFCNPARHRESNHFATWWGKLILVAGDNKCVLHYNILRSLHKIQNTNTWWEHGFICERRKLSIVQSIHSTAELQWACKEYWFMVNCYDVICLHTNIFMFHNNAELFLRFFNFLNLPSACVPLCFLIARYLFAFLKIIKSAGNENLFLRTWKADLHTI